MCAVGDGLVGGSYPSDEELEIARRLVPSNYWRAEEVITAVAARTEPEARELRDAYPDIYRRGSPRGLPHHQP
jgi:hypothetical protein